MTTLALKSSVKVFIGIPNLASHDRYSNYRGYVLNAIAAQETGATLMKPYITPPHAGLFQHGDDSRLNAIVGRMNNIVDKYMASDASHLWIVDGDVEPPVHAVDTLLRHNVDVASGVYPFKSFDSTKAMCFGRMKKDHPCGYLRPRAWEHMKGQVFGSKDEPWSGGTGCILIKRRVFKRHHPKIASIRFTRENNTCGLDVFFWKRVQDVGFTARVDANVVCSHLPKYRLKDVDKWLT